MKRTWTIIGVGDVPLFGQPETRPEHADFGQILDRVDDFEMSLKRARALVARLEEKPHVNPNTRTEEFSLRDPDGYYVTISSLTSPNLKGTRQAAA